MKIIILYFKLIIKIFWINIKFISNNIRTSSINFLHKNPNIFVYSSVIYIDFKELPYRTILVNIISNLRSAPLKNNQVFITYRTWRENPNIFIYTFSDSIFSLLRNYIWVRYFIRNKTFPLEKPVTWNYKPNFCIFIFFFFLVL